MKSIKIDSLKVFLISDELVDLFKNQTKFYSRIRETKASNPPYAACNANGRHR